MKKLLIGLLALGSVSAFAFENDNQVQICSNLMAIKSVSELEAKSYAARGYDSVTSVYMRVALNHLVNHINAIESALAPETDSLLGSIKESIIFEIQDSKNYPSYKTSTANRIFGKLARDISIVQKVNSCL